MSKNEGTERFLPELSPLTKLTPSGVSSLRPSDGSLVLGRPSWQRVSPLRDEYALGPTAWSRLGRLYRAEVETSPRVIERDWIADVSPHVPGLAISLHYGQSDVHEVYSRLRALDLAHRRVASLLMVASGAAAGSWQPVRPERGGLWLVRSDVGSFECVMTFYGELVNIAASTPVSLTSLASLTLILQSGGPLFVLVA